MTIIALDKSIASKLLLNSIDIRNYRVFEHLAVPQFGRVNLIVGKNNVGKSSLLEALWLYSQRGYPPVIQDLLRWRDEYVRVSRTEDLKERMWDIKNLFYGREEIREECPPITIGPIDEPGETFRLEVQWYVSKTDEGGLLVDRQLASDPTKKADAEPFAVLTFGQKIRRLIRLDRFIQRRFTYPLSEGDQLPAQFIKANGLDAQEIARLWDNIALTDLEDSIVAALHIIAPEVQRISFLGNKESYEKRIPVARVQELPEPIPVRSMGEGMNRILGIVLAVINAKNGVLLIDEIESGLHYSAQADIWRLIFNLAHRLNVQVFATTHSWDCISSFQVAAAEDPHEEGLLIRLGRRDKEISVTTFDERKLSIVTREQIEVR